MEELTQWLKSQHKGLQTYKVFQQRVLDLGAQNREHYALYYLLAMLVGRFLEAYVDNPLTLDVAEKAQKRLAAVTERASRYDSMSADDRLKMLNEIAAAELS